MMETSTGFDNHGMDAVIASMRLAGFADDEFNDAGGMCE